MLLCKLRSPSHEPAVGILEGDTIHVLTVDPQRGLSEILHADAPREAAKAALAASTESVSRSEATLLPPIDEQEVWAAGVTYKRSKEERERESEGAARFYDLVYTAERPELFLKSPAWRVRGPEDEIRIRADSKWNVPEPEITLVLSPRMEIVGYTIGNDVSSRDIEGENPLYLPQAKVYDGSCAVGPVICLAEAMPARDDIVIALNIEREGASVFEGQTSVSMLARSFEDLASWLGRETSFPNGVMLMTGTGVVPSEDFTLSSGDVVRIQISGIGELRNVVS